MSVLLLILRLIGFLIWPVLLPPTLSTRSCKDCENNDSRSDQHARSGPSDQELAFCRPRRAKYTEIQPNIPRRRVTGGTSTQLEFGPVTMRGNGVPKLFFLISTANTIFLLKSLGSLTPMALGWTQTTAEWSQTSLSKHCRTAQLPFMERENKPARFATSRISSRGSFRFMDSEEEITGPINLGNPVEFQISELADLILELTGSSSSIVYHALPGDDPKQRKPDISLAKAHLQWEPKTPLREGLMQTIAFLKGD